MPITIRCGDCGKTYQVGEALAGKKVKCRQCGAILALPGATPGTSATAAPAKPAAQSGQPAVHPRQTPAKPQASPQPSPLSNPLNGLLAETDALEPLAPASYSDPLNPLMALGSPSAEGNPLPLPGNPLAWNAGYGPAAAGTRSGVGLPAIVLTVAACAWAGYGSYLAILQIDRMLGLLDRMHGSASLTFLLMLFLRFAQLLCGLGILVAWGGLLLRQSWGTLAGVIAAATYFGMTFTWYPLIYPALTREASLMHEDAPRLGAMIVWAVIDFFMHMIMPAVFLIGFRNQTPRSVRSRGRSVLSILIAAAACGWAAYSLTACVQSFEMLHTLITNMERMQALDKLPARFWLLVLIRVAYFFAVLATVGASIGILLRQSWFPMLGMISAGACLALTILTVIVQLSGQTGIDQRPGMAVAVSVVIVLIVVKETIVPGVLMIYCIIKQNEQ